jgi:legumain
MVRATLLASLFASAQAAEWAVLVAGSNSYSNYRHQADVCHAYQVVKSQGIPESNIIVMAYDDIANNARNPFPGKMFNKPTASGTAGVDVYEGCNIDYKGSDVNPQNFMDVLTGSASGKKLESTSDDNVFVFFSDHGAAGLIAFPTGAGELHKADLQKTFDTMHTNNMYKKLTFYLETCESGSMFEGMSTPGVYALSASGPSESSWGTYCGSDAMVDGKSIGSCLGDLFSVNWMEDSDVEDVTSETLKQQADIVVTKTDKSKVMQWGDLSFQTDKVSEF